MKQERIRYKDVLDLGFNVSEVSDENYFNEFGFGYEIVTKNLTDLIYLDWEKETGFCFLVRIDGLEEGNIVAKRPIKNLDHLKDTVSFFTKEDKKDEEIHWSYYA